MKRGADASGIFRGKLMKQNDYLQASRCYSGLSYCIKSGKEKGERTVTIGISQPKTLLRIDEVFVFIAKDKDGEGVPAFTLPGGMMLPMVCADKARVDSLREMARTIARNTGNKITLCRFSVREELEVIEAVGE
jgi:hypothetical protein